MEKLCASIATSLIGIYLVSGVSYCLAPYALRNIALAYAGVCLAVALLCWKDIVALGRTVRVRSSLLGYGFLILWIFPLLAMIRNYSGADWLGDWFEHFQRSLFFLHRFPLDVRMLGVYPLAARPPLMNVVCAFFLAQTEDRFEIYQVHAAVLNLLVFLSCCLVMPALATKRRTYVVGLVGLFAMSPVVMETATYPWTKSLPTFFVVMAFWFYLAGWRKNDPGRMAAAFTALAAALLTHYSTAPYLLFFALHYLSFVLPKRRRKALELAAVAVPAALLLSTWFIWSSAHYGIYTTLASNTSVGSSQMYSGGGNLKKIGGNIVDTLIPPFLRDPALLNQFDQPNRWGWLRDNFFITYQANLIFGMGIVGGPFVLWMLYRKISQGRAGWQPAFWWLAIPFCVAVGIAATGERDPLGVAHITLLTVVLLGLTLAATALPAKGALRWLLLAGCCIDFFLGVFLNGRIESLDIHPPRPVLTDEGRFATVGGPALSASGARNWFLKNQYALTAQFLAAAQKHDSPGFQQLRRPLEQSLHELDYEYQGWYSRHGGVTEFLGDHLAGPSFAGLDIASLLLLGLWVALLREMCKAPPAVKFQNLAQGAQSFSKLSKPQE